MDAAVFFESEYRPVAPLVQAKRKIDDTAVFSESEIDVKEVKVVPVSSEHEYPAPDLLIDPDWLRHLQDQCFNFDDCDHNHQHILSDYRPRPPVTVGRGFLVLTFLEYFVEEMTSDSGPYNDKTNSVVVTNLPLRTRDSDLFDLFHPFGATLAHVATAKDFNFTGRFGFVNFATKEQAQNAVDNGGFVYRNYPLGVEWVTPKTT